MTDDAPEDVPEPRHGVDGKRGLTVGSSPASITPARPESGVAAMPEADSPALQEAGSAAPRAADSPAMVERDSAAPPGAVSPDPPGADPSSRPSADATASAAAHVDRRAFFRSFGRQTVSTVAQVAGLASAFSRGTTSMLSGVMEMGLGDPAANAERLERGMQPGLDASAAGTAQVPAILSGEAFAAQGGTGYRSPYRVDGDTLYLLDQRLLPDRLEEIACRGGPDVAVQMRTMSVSGGALLAQVAAYGVALTARNVADRRPQEREAEIRRSIQALIYARPACRMVRWAMAQMEEAAAALDQEAPGEDIADALRGRADELAWSASIGQARIARGVAGLWSQTAGVPIYVLVHGDPGALTSGSVGTALAGIQQLGSSGQRVRVWITETRPHLEGARLAAWELRLADIEHTVLADGAVAWLLEHEPIDAVLLGGEWIAANGDTANVIGSRVVAEMAALGIRGGGPVPVYVCAPLATVDLATPDGRGIPPDMRPGRELATYGAGKLPAGGEALNPALDVVPARCITGFVTEEGVLRPPYPEALRTATAERSGGPA